MKVIATVIRFMVKRVSPKKISARYVLVQGKHLNPSLVGGSKDE